MPMRFSSLAETLEALEPVSSRTEMLRILAGLLAQADPEEVGELVYLVQGRLQPDFIGQEFGMNERLLVRAMAQAYGLPQDAAIDRFKQVGDAGTLAQELASSAGQNERSADGLALNAVYSRLMQITQTVGQGSQEGKVNLVVSLLRELDPLEAKHVIRIIVGRLRVGVGDPTLMEALSVAKVGDKSLRPPIERAYNLASDLGLVARTLYSSGVEGLEQIRVRVGNPVRMALAERAGSIEEIVERLGKCAVEPKFDGFRMQIHKNGEQVSIFSRGLENLSGMFPDVVAAINNQIDAEQAIFEGEALTFDTETGIFADFQVTTRRRRIHNIEEMSARFPLRLMAFDLLLLNNDDLTRAPYEERRAKLVAAIKPTDGLAGIRPSDCIVSDNVEEIELFYEDSLVEGLEGIVAKRLSGTYDAGKRGFNWIKMKRSYESQLSDTVDCVIVGYDYGKGARAKFGMGSLLVSVYDKSNDTLPTVTRVSSGLSNEAWKDLYRRLSEDKIHHPDPRVRYVLTPDVWVVPRYVFEVRADNVSRSPMHAAGRVDGEPGYALRFPRIVKERTERSPDDATSVEEVIELYNLQGKGDTRGKRKKALEAQQDEEA